MVDYSRANWSYSITTEPTTKPLTLTEVKSWLRISDADTSDDDLLNMLIDAAIGFGEKVSRQVFSPTGFTTFRSGWSEKDQFAIGGNEPLVLRRSPLNQVDSVEYLIEGVFTPFTDFFTQTLDEYSKIRPNEDECWPEDQDMIQQSVKIVFTAGYTTLPADLQIALLRHIAFMYENRGDCACDNASATDSGALLTYRQYKIMEC